MNLKLVGEIIMEWTSVNFAAECLCMYVQCRNRERNFSRSERPIANEIDLSNNSNRMIIGFCRRRNPRARHACISLVAQEDIECARVCARECALEDDYVKIRA